MVTTLQKDLMPYDVAFSFLALGVLQGVFEDVKTLNKAIESADYGRSLLCSKSSPVAVASAGSSSSPGPSMVMKSSSMKFKIKQQSRDWTVFIRSSVASGNLTFASPYSPKHPTNVAFQDLTPLDADHFRKDLK